MTPFLLLTFVMGALTITWMTRPLWQRNAMPADADANTAPRARMRRSAGLVGGVAIFVLAIAGLGYTLLGAPQFVDTGPSGTTAVSAAQAPSAALESRGGAAPSDSLVQAESRVSAMVDSLAERLKTRPDDADGWQLLGRSYAALGRHTQAIAAFKNAVRLRPDDATVLAEYAFSAAVLDPHGANGEPARLTARALQLDPKNPKALALAGTLALDRKDYQGAIQYWEQLAQVEPADSPVARQVQTSILQARQLAGTHASVIPAAALAPAQLATSGDAAQVSGTVTLSPALKARVSPDDTVFVFARAPGGPRMPLAVLRKQVKDLPLRFRLDDSQAMSPAAKLSGASSVVVGARISKSGSAIAQDGDLQGQLAAVRVGSSDLKIPIDEVVKTR